MLHKILTERRRSLGLSIDQLVEKSGVPKGTLTKVLTGASANPALETVKAIAYALGLTLNDLEENRVPSLSPKSVAVAQAYEHMTPYGRSLIDVIVENESKYGRAIRIISNRDEERMEASKRYSEGFSEEYE